MISCAKYIPLLGLLCSPLAFDEAVWCLARGAVGAWRRMSAVWLTILCWLFGPVGGQFSNFCLPLPYNLLCTNYKSHRIDSENLIHVKRIINSDSTIQIYLKKCYLVILPLWNVVKNVLLLIFGTRFDVNSNSHKCIFINIYDLSVRKT